MKKERKKKEKQPQIKQKEIKPPNLFHLHCQWLTDWFLKQDKKEGINFGCEIRIAQRLLKETPDIEFWRSLNLGFKLNSLAYFLTEDGKERLQKEKSRKSIELPAPKSYSLDNTLQIINNPTESNKPKNLVEFLNNK